MDQNYEKLKIKVHDKQNFPYATRAVTKQLQNQLMKDQCDNNEKLYLAKKIF